MTTDQTETILIVDDEEPVRRTFREWLTGAGLACTILAAADAEAALQLANQHPIDLAILDWALGAGDDGLHLLQDLGAFHPDVVAIMVTGYANQATPLHAMRMGVRDYLDKNHDLSRDTFLHAVRRQLDQIRPAKRARQLHHTLVAFREAVEKILPLVQSASALHDPVPLPDAVRGLVQFLCRITGAVSGVLLVRSYDAARQPAEFIRVYVDAGLILNLDLVPFARSLAGTAVSMQEACMVEDLGKAGPLDLQPFEVGRRSVLAVPMMVSPGLHAVMELLDKTTPGATFGAEDKRLVQSAAGLGTDSALLPGRWHTPPDTATAAGRGGCRPGRQPRDGRHPARHNRPAAGRAAARASSRAIASGVGAADSGDRMGAEQTLRLAEAIRVLAVRHGSPALEHCLRLVEEVRALLDQVLTPP